MLWLHIGVERFPLRQGETTLGRSLYCSIVINSSSVSREHAVVEVDGDDATLSDVGSRNGTLLNGQRLTGAALLHGGDRIGVGGADIAVVEGPRAEGEMTTTAERRVPTEPPPPAKTTQPGLVPATTAPPPEKRRPPE